MVFQLVQGDLHIAALYLILAAVLNVVEVEVVQVEVVEEIVLCDESFSELLILDHKELVGGLQSSGHLLDLKRLFVIKL